MIEFDEYKQRAAALKPMIEQIGSAMNLEETAAELAKLEAQSSDPAFWDNMEESGKVLKQIKRLKDKLELHAGLSSRLDDLETLISLAIDEEDDSISGEIFTELTELETDVERAHLSALLSGEYDASNAIVSFHAGAGGTEAQDWALMLYRMYMRWAEKNGYKCTVLSCLDGDEAGIKSADLLIEGDNAYGYLKSEAGVHRLVRISPFDASGRRHTSFAAVEVMPEIDDSVEIEIRDEDLKVDTYRSGGAGGQHVNKTESAIRITHIPTGIVVACQNERSQHQNREVAMRMLRSRLVEIKERENLEKIEDIKGTQKLIEWGSQIRSYVFMPYTLVKDNRTGFEMGNVDAVMDGDLDGFMAAYLSAAANGTLKTK